MITELTADQEAKMPEYVKKWTAIGLNTDRIDEKKCLDAIKLACRCADEKEIGELRLCSSPDDLVKQVLAFDKTITFNDIQFGWGNQEAGWLSFYDFFKNETEVEGLEIVEGLIQLAEHAHWFVFFEDVAFVSQKPTEIHLDEENRLSNEDGPAVLYEDGFSIYSVRGVSVSSDVVNRNYTVKDIDEESNQEVKRIMIELYGEDKYLMDSNAEKVHSDNYGTLYRKEVTGDETIVMVKVVNSTPEPDGSFKDYFLRVPPHIEKAKQGIAWGFGFDSTDPNDPKYWDNYAPLQET